MLENPINNNELITLIIPTINRLTLIDTLESLENQTNPDWKAICVFDNVTPDDNIKLKLDSDPRFKYIILSKKLGQNRNFAGLVRNVGIRQANTEWIGFVDDDDTLTPYYVQRLKEELIVNSDVECIIFRMICEKKIQNVELVEMSEAFQDKNRSQKEIPFSSTDYDIIPPSNATTIRKGRVGISFCYKLKLFYENLNFFPSSIEDFLLLKQIKLNKKKILISPYVTYQIKLNKISLDIDQIEQKNSRIIIN